MKLKYIVKNIVVELTRLQSMPVARQTDGDDFPFPRMIDGGDGGGIVISKKIDNAIADVAKRLLDNDQSLKTRYTQAEWRAAVRRCFGPALASIDLNDKPDDNAKIVLRSVREALSNSQARQLTREHAFGCSLFSDATIDAFAIGPVRFETRAAWLARQSDAGYISKVTAQRIEKAWQGKSLTKRKVSNESIAEDAILDAVGTCPFVCSVTTTGIAHEAAKEKALTAARLALAVIALLWRTPSKALSGFNLLFDRSVRRVKTLTFVQPKHVLSGSFLSHMPYGPWLEPGAWDKLMRERRNHFAVAGEILDYILSPTGNVARPKLMNTFAQGLMWFHEGCRETVSLIAIVKFTASMDALAGGHGESAICRVMTARLGLKPGDPIWRDGPLLSEAIKKIYGEGRSRTIHGTNDKFGWDWTDTKGLAEQFARLCLVTCMDWAAQNTGSGDPALLQK